MLVGKVGLYIYTAAQLIATLANIIVVMIRSYK